MQLKDQEARQSIAEDLDTNILVLAGAGAGKTYSLVQRMTAMIRTGRMAIDEMAAITFTRKAAGEMRERLLERLQEEEEEASGLPAERLSNALRHLDQCFIGTIHSFCARMLRQRPIEAGVAPDFTEADERSIQVVRREAWDQFIQEKLTKGSDRLNWLEEAGLPPEDLFQFFKQRCRFSDLALKPTGTDRPPLQKAVERVWQFVENVQPFIPSSPPKGRDPFMEAVVDAKHFYHNRGFESDADRVSFLRLFSRNPKVKVTYWGDQRDRATEIRDEKLPDLEEELAPILRQWREYLYNDVSKVIEEAMDTYHDLRMERGLLTFQDLLLKVRAMLRDYPAIRGYFQQRFQCLFVDEFQDTDPIQAEILFYLTGQDRSERDWQKLSPRPGSLFLVGDGKQSIYRFRRADIDIFRFVQERIENTGGQVVHLNTSFRSLGNFCNWVNDSFADLFAEHDADYQPPFSPLYQYREDGADPVCVRSLSVEKIARNPREDIARRNADDVGQFIAAALQGATRLNGSTEDAVLPDPATPGDFMILTRTTSQLTTYAKALEQREIPYDIVGGGELGDSDEVQGFVEMLEAVHHPDDPLPFLGYLRGPLVGLSDDDLLAFREAGGEFHYRTPIPDDVSDDVRNRLERAIDQLREAAHIMGSQSPGSAIPAILDQIGLPGFAASRPLGSSRAGNLLRLQALVHQWEDQHLGWEEVLAELRALIDDSTFSVEEMTLETGRDDVVRLMNLHQAKGLQAPVVILADPYDTSAAGHDPDFHVSRLADEPYLSMPVRKPVHEHYSRVVAEPENWKRDKDEERRYQRAEELRLLYVAATRARNLLVVSRYEGNEERGPWSALYPYLTDVPELSIPEVQPTPSERPDIPPERLAALQRDRSDRWRAVSEPGYTVHRITERDEERWEQLQELGGRGRSYGVLVHQLLEEAVEGRLPDDLDAYARSLCAQHGVESAYASEAVHAVRRFRASELWGFIETAHQICAEVPFVVPKADDGEQGIVRGIIDLLVQRDDGWLLVDYKTDRVPDTDRRRQLIDHYRDQVEKYAQFWESIAGEKVAEKGLWFTDPGTFVPLDGPTN